MGTAFGRSARRGAALALVLAAAGLSVGCASGDGAEMEALRLENEELRMSRDELAAALDECDARVAAVSNERDRLESQVNQLRSELAQARAMVSERPTTTGFEGTSATVYGRPGELVVEMAGDILFSSGKAELREQAKRELDRIARTIQQRYPDNLIRIAGHTDSDPIRKSGWKTNERLGAERALSVEEYLSTRGLSKDRMYVASYGPAEPRSSKKDSRRVEIVILAPDAS